MTVRTPLLFAFLVCASHAQDFRIESSQRIEPQPTFLTVTNSRGERISFEGWRWKPGSQDAYSHQVIVTDPQGNRKIVQSWDFGFCHTICPFLWVTAMQVDSDDSVYLIGGQYSVVWPSQGEDCHYFFNNSSCPFLMKLSAHGEVVFVRMLSRLSHVASAQSLHVTQNGEVVVVVEGAIDFAGDRDTLGPNLHILRFQRDGTPSKTHSFHVVGEMMGLTRGRILRDGDLLIFGTIRPPVVDYNTWRRDPSKVSFETTPSSWQPKYGGGESDGFLLRFNMGQDRVEFSSFAGGDGTDQMGTVHELRDEMLLVPLRSTSRRFPVEGMIEGSPPPTLHDFNTAVLKISPDGSRGVAGGVIGGSGSTGVFLTSEGQSGTLYFLGLTNASDLSVPHAFDPQLNEVGAEPCWETRACRDIVLMTFDRDLQTQFVGSFMGGAKEDHVSRVRFEANRLSLRVTTYSAGFPQPWTPTTEEPFRHYEVKVRFPKEDFSLSASQTERPLQRDKTEFTLQLAPAESINMVSDATLSCEGLEPGWTCTFSENPVSIADDGTTVSLVVRRGAGPRSSLWLGLSALGLAAVFVLRSARSQLAPLAVLTIAVTALGCGMPPSHEATLSSSAAQAQPAANEQEMTFTVKARSGILVKTLPLKVRWSSRESRTR